MRLDLRDCKMAGGRETGGGNELRLQPRAPNAVWSGLAGNAHAIGIGHLAVKERAYRPPAALSDGLRSVVSLAFPPNMGALWLSLPQVPLQSPPRRIARIIRE